MKKTLKVDGEVGKVLSIDFDKFWGIEFTYGGERYEVDVNKLIKLLKEVLL